MLGIEKDLTKSIVDFGGGNNNDDNDNNNNNKNEDDAGNTFSEQLKTKEQQYKDYTLALKNNDDELAAKLKEKYKLKEQDYVSYLRNLYEHTKDFENKATILNAIEGQGSSLIPREKVKPLESTIKPQPLVLDIKFDSKDYIKSINQLNRELRKLEEERTETNSKNRKQELDALISNKRKELDVARGNIAEEKNLYENLIGNLSNPDKGNKIQNTANTIKDVAGILTEASALFRKFGEEDIAKLLDQLSGVAEGVSDIMKGDPVSIIKGSLKVLNSALTVEVVSDTAKYEKAIKELEKSIDKLDYVISKSVGQDKVSSRKEAIDDLEELEKQAEKAKEAELNARKEVKLLGISVGKKGKGSGTDPAKLEELEQKAEEARRKAVELKEQLDQLYTGTTETTIIDSIISGLKEGKRSAADFADNFKDLMQNAMLEAFKIKYLEKEVEKFYDAFADAGEDSNFTASEIASLRALYTTIISGAQSDLDAINKVLEDTGIGALGEETTDNRTGLSGAISTITEDTANILAGTLNSIRIDVAGGIQIAQQSSNYLAQIVQNTSYNRYLESMDTRLNSIETLLS